MVKQSFQEFLKEKRTWFKTIKIIRCPILNEDVVFNSRDFYHLRYDNHFNIGAHMEKDIDIIIDVEPEEAQLLIGLIEQLVDEWYVAREDRKNRAQKLKDLATSKKNPPIQAE